MPATTLNWRRYIHTARWSLLSLVIAALLMWVAYLWGPRLITWTKAAANRQRESEAAYWRRFKRSCDENDASQIYARLLAWLQRSRPGVTLGEFQKIAGDLRLDQQIDGLSRVLFRPSASVHVEGRSFYAAVAPHRRGNETIEPAVHRLPALNP